VTLGKTLKGPSIKDVRSQGGGRGLSSANILRTRDGEEFFRCKRPLFSVKNRQIFRNLFVRTDKEEVCLVRTFFGQREVNFFSILCGRLLWMAPNEIAFIGFIFI